jgi:hypothetical protein
MSKIIRFCGVDFRIEDHARWAAFFQVAGVEWEYLKQRAFFFPNKFCGFSFAVLAPKNVFEKSFSEKRAIILDGEPRPTMFYSWEDGCLQDYSFCAGDCSYIADSGKDWGRYVCSGWDRREDNSEYFGDSYIFACKVANSMVFKIV